MPGEDDGSVGISARATEPPRKIKRTSRGTFEVAWHVFEDPKA